MCVPIGKTNSQSIAFLMKRFYALLHRKALRSIESEFAAQANHAQLDIIPLILAGSSVANFY